MDNPYRISFHFEDGRTEVFNTTEYVWENLFTDVMSAWVYVPYERGGALVKTEGLSWLSVYPDPTLSV